MIRKYLALLIATLLLGVLALESPVHSPETQKQEVLAEIVATTNPMLAEVNRVRAEAGKPPLVEDRRLSVSAGAKAKDLVNRGYWSHDTPEGESFSILVYRYSPDASAVGENLAKCHSDPVSAWTESPSHYQNMIDDWKYWGTGSATDDRCNFIVNHFSR